MKKTAIKLKSFHTLKIAGISTVIAATLLSLKFVTAHTSYTVTRIIDGDTFETQEKQIVRINGIQAPEENLCGWEEAKTHLSSKILNKKVYLKVVYLDAYRRMIADVYLKDGSSLSHDLAKQGVVYVLQKGKPDDTLLALGNIARKKEIGIYGFPCTQKFNSMNPTCSIKGNVVDGNKRTYHKIGCNQYSFTKIQTYLGDQWFCTEKEAEKAGFKKSKDCP